MGDHTITRYARLINDIEFVLTHRYEKLAQWEREFLRSLHFQICAGLPPAIRRITVARLIINDVVSDKVIRPAKLYVIRNSIPIIVPPKAR